MTKEGRERVRPLYGRRLDRGRGTEAQSHRLRRCDTVKKYVEVAWERVHEHRAGTLPDPADASPCTTRSSRTGVIYVDCTSTAIDSRKKFYSTRNIRRHGRRSRTRLRTRLCSCIRQVSEKCEAERSAEGDEHVLRSEVRDRARDGNHHPFATKIPNSALRADYRKEFNGLHVQAEVQFGNMARWYSDIFKFQAAYSGESSSGSASASCRLDRWPGRSTRERGELRAMLRTAVGRLSITLPICWSVLRMMRRRRSSTLSRRSSKRCARSTARTTATISGASSTATP